MSTRPLASISTHLVSLYGFCQGKAELGEQVQLWKRMLEVLQAAKGPKQSPCKSKNTRASAILQTNSSVLKSKDFYVSCSNLNFLRIH